MNVAVGSFRWFMILNHKCRAVLILRRNVERFELLDKNCFNWRAETSIKALSSTFRQTAIVFLVEFYVKFLMILNNDCSIRLMEWRNEFDFELSHLNIEFESSVLGYVMLPYSSSAYATNFIPISRLVRLSHRTVSSFSPHFATNATCLHFAKRVKWYASYFQTRVHIRRRHSVKSD